MRHFYTGFLLCFWVLVAPALSAQSSGCDSTFRPIVFVHGFLASGDTWANFVRDFQAVGYCPDRLYAFDWNTLDRTVDHNSALDVAIESLLARTGAKQVDLIGHSAGGGLGYLYLTDSVRAAKVARFVQIGSMSQGRPAGPTGETPMLNLWSDGDRVVAGKEIPGAVNVMLPGLDHYQCATSRTAFETVFRFLNGTVAPVAGQTPGNPLHIGGRALFFGENIPVAGAGVEMYYVDSRTGARIGEAAVVTETDAQGYWSAEGVRPHVPVELVVRATLDARPIHYYREGFSHPNSLVYLRTLPKPGSVVSLMLAGLPKAPEQSVVNVFSADQAVVYGRDTLLVDGIPLSTDKFAPAEKTVISFFLYDGNNNKKSELAPVGMFGRFPFLMGVDIFLNPKKSKPMTFLFNGRKLVVRKIPASEGIQVVVFD